MTGPTRLLDARTDFGSPARVARLQRPAARALAIGAVTLGVVADSLFHDGPGGLGLAIWVALAAFTFAGVMWRAGRSVPREAAAWLAAAVLFAAALAWRDAEVLTLFNVLATAWCLAMAAIRLRAPRAALFAAHFRETLAAGFRLALDVAAGIVPVVFRDLARPERRAADRGRAVSIARAALLSAAVLLVFGSLLRAADPMFASFISLPDVDFGEAASHVGVVGFFAWLVAGWARSALLPQTERRVPSYGFSLRLLDVTAVLATLDVLFAAFVLAQLGWIFGGEAFLRARTGLTAAAFARQGFFQMAWAVALVIPVLVVSRGGLAAGAELRRRHTLLSLPAVGLLGAMIASALLRMKMYVHYYGLTTDRVYPIVAMVWLAFVLAWLASTVLRGRGRTFVAGAIISGLVTLGGLDAADPDLIVARVNVDRAATLAPGSTAGPSALDLAHLASLRGGAVPIAARVVANSATIPIAFDADAKAAAAARCDAAQTLLRHWGPKSSERTRVERPAAWRYWNADEATSLTAVAANAPALQAVVQRFCPPPAANGATQTVR
jgi:hypothetical protein